MSKTVKKRLSLITVFAIIITCFGNMALAFDNGYKDATEYTTSVTDYITSESQVDWYKFTLTADQVPAPYSITLVVPDDCLYNFVYATDQVQPEGRVCCQIQQLPIRHGEKL